MQVFFILGLSMGSKEESVKPNKLLTPLLLTPSPTTSPSGCFRVSICLWAWGCPWGSRGAPRQAG